MTFTTAQIWGWVLAICGGIITLSTVCGIIANAVSRIRKPAGFNDEEYFAFGLE